MSRLVNTLKKSFKKMIERNWDTVYIFVDMHETVMEPTWNSIPSVKLYPMALDTLKLMSEHENIKLILWSSSLPHINLEYQKLFKESGVIFSAINSNPFEKDTEYADFTTKPYISLILDDKAGFVPVSDWSPLYDYMVMIKALAFIKAITTNDAKNFLFNLKINQKYGF